MNIENALLETSSILHGRGSFLFRRGVLFLFRHCEESATKQSGLWIRLALVVLWVLPAGICRAGDVTISNGGYKCVVDGTTGTGLRLTQVKNNFTVLGSGDVGWELVSKSGPAISSKNLPAVAKTTKNSVELVWTGGQAAVTVTLTLDGRDGLGLRIAVTNRGAAPIMEIVFPLAANIDQRQFEELIVADHIGTAVSMDRWFEKGGTLGDGIPYPTAHCDLLVARGKPGRPSVAFACPHTEELLTPSQMYYGKTGDHVGSFRHRFFVWIPKDATWTSPAIRVYTSRDVFEAFERYREMLGLDKARTLKEKLGDKFEAASKVVVLKYECAWHGGKAIREFDALTKDLPRPLIYEPVEYWPVRFDDHYPDYFPINEKLGTDEQFRAMIDTAHKRGDLMMPFFSPGHWSLDSPSTKKAGPQVAAVDADGKPYLYDGRPNYGLNYYVTAWNPLVMAKAVENARQFKSFGCDAAFADIVGNNKKDWDFNPATPNPRAFFAGMIRLGAAMANELPMTTEGGSDLHSANFWGMFQFFLKVKYKFTGHQPWRKSDGYDPRWAAMSKDRAVRLYPMDTALASGLAMVYPHNLGPPILEQEMLNDSLAMGMGMYMTYQQVTEGQGQWLRYLHYIQREVVQYYFGKRMTGFEYIAGYDDVSTTRWEGLDLYVNHTRKAATMTIDGREQTLKPFGMVRVMSGKTAEVLTFEEWKNKK